MSAHDHPGLADVTDLAVTIAFLQRVLSVHEIASCHFDLRSPHIVYVPLVDGTAAFLRVVGDALHGTVDGGLDALVAEVLVHRAGELRFRCELVGRRGFRA